MIRTLKLIGLFSLTSFSSSVFAADGAAASTASPFGPFLFLIVLLAFMYLLVWRPQQKKAKAQKELINSVSKGDELMTNGGLLGKVTEVYENHVELSIAEGTELLLSKSAVTTTLPKGTIKSLKTK